MHNCVTEMCSGSEAGSYSRLVDFMYHSNLGLRETKKRRRTWSMLAEAGFPEMSLRMRIAHEMMVSCTAPSRTAQMHIVVQPIHLL